MTSGITVLTGASRGLGRVLLDELVARREQVIVVGRNLSDAQARFPSSNELVSGIECDLSQANHWSEGAGLPRDLRDELARRSFSALTFLNNAGSVKPIGSVGSLSTQELLASVAANFTAPALIADACLRHTAPLGIPSRVINISSGASRNALAGWAAYCGSKAAARMFFDVVSIEGTATVVHIDPGVMDTGMQGDIRNATESSFPQVERFRQMKANGRLALPADVARSIVAEHYGAKFGAGAAR